MLQAPMERTLQQYLENDELAAGIVIFFDDEDRSRCKVLADLIQIGRLF